MRWLIIVSGSLARSLAPSSLPIRPSSTIWSSRPFSSTCSVACGAAFCASAIGTSRGLVHFLLQLVQLSLIADSAQQRFLQTVVALQAGAEVTQLGAQVHEFRKRLDLAHDVFRLEVVHALKMQVDFKLRGVGGLAQC